MARIDAQGRHPARTASDLARLTGVRSGKRSYYREFVRSDGRTKRTVRALDAISHALVRTSEGPRGLMDDIARAAGEQLVARWSILCLRDGKVPWASPRFVVVDSAGRPCAPDRVPAELVPEIEDLRAGAVDPEADARWVRAALTVDGEDIGALEVFHGLDSAPDEGDLALLRILANQAAVALRTFELYQSGIDLQHRAAQLYDEVSTYARDLATSATQLQLTKAQLVAADQRALVDSERHRIARELHDSVSQIVLSAGLAVDLARLDSAELGSRSAHVTSRLDQAKELTSEAMHQLRAAIYALHHTERSASPASLSDLLEDMADGYRPQLDISIRVRSTSESIPEDVEHELARIAGEALFNVVTHARASRAVVSVRGTGTAVALSISDDGVGDARSLRQALEVEQRSAGGIGHRGLANMASRAAELGADLRIRRSSLGGIQVKVSIPLGSESEPDAEEAS
ncbi:GAF domain-containing sensor histidine kinase [Dietzia sp.]|uniref:GAF domain-containing sensor histidine kinase n=1 Tax=Dietzia sp. TaxID=1871616 RepID=UPI002FD9C897